MKRNIEVKLEPVFEKLHLAKAALSACSRGLVWEERDETNFWWQIDFLHMDTSLCALASCLC